MRILLFGRSGQVGWELRRTLAPLGMVTALARADAPLDDADAIVRAIRSARPDVVVNAAAYTAVDRAESDADAAHAVNAVAPGIMAETLRQTGGTLVHYSTDYVFDGAAGEAYTEDMATRPLGVYGASKLAGEAAIRAADISHVILRTSWVYGLRGSNFLRTMVRLGAERQALSVVADQHGAPTWSRLIAEGTAQLLSAAGADRCALRGTWHMTSSGATTWHGFAEAIVHRWYGSEAPAVEPVTTAAYGAPAPRPLNSVLSCARLAADFGIALPHWEAALDLVREEAAAADGAAGGMRSPAPASGGEP